jgi:hypothetical protein
LLSDSLGYDDSSRLVYGNLHGKMVILIPSRVKGNWGSSSGQCGG